MRAGVALGSNLGERIAHLRNARREIAAMNGAPVPLALPPPQPAAGTTHNFRFYDNRQKYLLFVTTCSEKWVVAQRVGMELANIHPRLHLIEISDRHDFSANILDRSQDTLA